MFLSSVALQQAVMGRPCMQNRTNGSVAVVGPHATAEAIKIDVTAGPMKTLLATSFARALSELPAEKVAKLARHIDAHETELFQSRQP